MKTFKYSLQLIVLAFTILFGACTKDYDMPPLTEKVYTGPKANMTIEELKKLYPDASNPVLIEVDYILHGYVAGNDIAGNIYKQLYVQDKSGAILFGVEQSEMNSLYPIGQEVYINLHGLYILKYGGEFQIGYAGTNANRIPPAIFQRHISLNGWAAKDNIKPMKVELANLNPNMVNMLVKLDNIYFENGGKGYFISPDNAKENKTTEELIKDSFGNSVLMRTSSYATPFSGKLLPKGMGSVVGILGRHNGAWQFTLRDIGDVLAFDGGDPVIVPKPGGTVFSEDFGTKGNKEKIALYTGYTGKTDKISYSDPTTNADIRTLTGNSHVWLPAAKDASFKIEGISTTGSKDLVLKYKVAASLFEASESTNLNVVQVLINGTAQTVTSLPVSNANGDHNKFHEITIENFPIADNITLEFLVKSPEKGMRLDDIIIASKDKTIVPAPKK